MERKEKLMLFRQLQDETQAEKDLKLLAKLNPAHKDLPRFARNPSYYAAHILYALLDVCGKDDVLDNRKPVKEDGSSDTLTNGSSEALTDKDDEENKQAVVDERLDDKEPDEPPVNENGSPADKDDHGATDEPLADENEQNSDDDEPSDAAPPVESPSDAAPPEESPSEDAKKK